MLTLANKVVVRKYRNRKLYLPSEGRYTNGPELLRLYKQGFDIEIVNHNTGRDITLEAFSNLMNTLGEYYVLQQFLNEMIVVTDVSLRVV